LLARSACKEPRVQRALKGKNNEKISNSWNSFGSFSCFGISLLGHFDGPEHEADHAVTSSERHGTGKPGRIARSVAG